MRVLGGTRLGLDGWRPWRSLLVASIAVGLLLGAVATGSDSAVKGVYGLTVKEAYDSNVYIQDNDDVLSKQGSFVTSVTPSVGMTYKPCDYFTTALSYAPEVVFYHGEPSEDYVAHRGNINFTSKVGKTTWEALNSIVWIDGNKFGPTFTGGGDVPAIGGIPLRDRRDAAIYRNALRVPHLLGDWMLRPVLNSYVHDFQTKQFTQAQIGPVGVRSYENYIDRYEISGGLDLGRRLTTNSWLILGYRYGHQQQQRLNDAVSPYSNDYQRIVAGIEGSPVSWLKLAILAGPDFRHFGLPGLSPRFNGNELLYYVDASVTWLPGRQDTVTAKATRYEQPAFSSHSVYEDIRYDLAWKHKFGEKLAVSAAFTLYIGDWQAPASREDWIYSPSATATYVFDRHFSAELSYLYDWVESKVPTSVVRTSHGREWTRHLISLSVKYAY